MSRVIKFRGQTRKKGQYVDLEGNKRPGIWVYGGIFPQNGGGDFAIIYTQPECEKRVVYADTVGQYTGVMDKNLEEIYEGDIVNIDGEDEYFLVSWDCSAAKFVMRGDGVVVNFDNFYGCEIEVISNIYDGLELMEPNIEMEVKKNENT